MRVPSLRAPGSMGALESIPTRQACGPWPHCLPQGVRAGDLMGTHICEQVLSLNFQQLSLGFGGGQREQHIPTGGLLFLGRESWEQGYRNSMLWGWTAEPAALHSIV